MSLQKDKQVHNYNLNAVDANLENIIVVIDLQCHLQEVHADKRVFFFEIHISWDLCLF